MLNNEELKWLAANATELNRLLQQAARQVEQTRQRNGEQPHLQTLGDQLERASRSSQASFDRITGRVLAGEGNGRKSGPAAESRRESATIANPSFSARMPVGEVAIAEGYRTDRASPHAR